MRRAFLPAEGDDLCGTEALRGISCSCCSHKVSLIPAKISVQLPGTGVTLEPGFISPRGAEGPGTLGNPVSRGITLQETTHALVGKAGHSVWIRNTTDKMISVRGGSLCWFPHSWSKLLHNKATHSLFCWWWCC